MNLTRWPLVLTMLLVAVLVAKAVDQDATPVPDGGQKESKEKREQEKSPADPLKMTVQPSQGGPRDIYDALTLFVLLENVGRDQLNVRAIYLLVGDDLARTRTLCKSIPLSLESVDTTNATTRSSSGPTGAGAATNPVVSPAPKPSDRKRPIDFEALNLSSDGRWFGRKELRRHFDIDPAHQLRASVLIPSASGRDASTVWFPVYLWDLLSNVYLLSYSPQQHEVQVVVEYSVGTDSADLRLAIVPLKLSFTASVGAIMLGGLIGCFLLCTFRAGASLADHATEFEKSHRWDLLRRGTAIVMKEYSWLLVGSPAVVILTLLLIRLGTGDFPISFKVSDFTGGILLGLFSRALVVPLTNRLFPKGKRVPQAAKAIKKSRIKEIGEPKSQKPTPNRSGRENKTRVSSDGDEVAIHNDL